MWASSQSCTLTLRLWRSKTAQGYITKRNNILTKSHVLYAILLPQICSRASVRKQKRACRAAAPQRWLTGADPLELIHVS